MSFRLQCIFWDGEVASILTCLLSPALVAVGSLERASAAASSATRPWNNHPPHSYTRTLNPQAAERTEMGDSAPGQLSLKKEAASMAAIATTNGLLTAGEGSSGGRADQTLEEEEEEEEEGKVRLFPVR